MAEGFLRALGGDRFEAASAGTEATRVHPLAIRVMDEVGIDLGGHSSKTFDQFLPQPWDCVITVCDNANAQCPIFPARTTRLHWSFEDPSAASGSEDERLRVFRRIRDEIRGRLEGFIASGRGPSEVHTRPITTRRATKADAEAISRIYNQGIEDRIATFETRPRTAEDIAGWFDGVHPAVVAEESGRIVGFASTSSYRPRECYAKIAEFSVYVARDHRGRGVGRRARGAHRGITQGRPAQARVADLPGEPREPGRLPRGGLPRGRRLQGARPARRCLEGLRRRRTAGGRVGDCPLTLPSPPRRGRGNRKNPLPLRGRGNRYNPLSP